MFASCSCYMSPVGQLQLFHIVLARGPSDKAASNWNFANITAEGKDIEQIKQRSWSFFLDGARISLAKGSHLAKSDVNRQECRILPQEGSRQGEASNIGRQKSNQPHQDKHQDRGLREVASGDFGRPFHFSRPQSLHFVNRNHSTTFPSLRGH